MRCNFSRLSYRHRLDHCRQVGRHFCGHFRIKVAMQLSLQETPILYSLAIQITFQQKKLSLPVTDWEL